MRHVERLSKPIVRSTIIALAVFAASALAAPVTRPLAAQRPAGVDVWFEGGNSFDRGAIAPLRYSADPGTYVTLVRVDGDGRFSILWPTSPNDRSSWRGPRDGVAVPFRADASDGVGYVFAIASPTPFDFRRYRTPSGRWMMSAFAQQVGADPFELVDRFARSVTGGRRDYSIAYAPYETGSGAYHVRTAYDDRGAVYSADDYARGYGDTYDGSYGSYDAGYGYAFVDPWIASPFRRRFRDFRFPAFPFSSDPRTRFARHCPDGTLSPFTTPCGPGFGGRGRGRGIDRGIGRGIDHGFGHGVNRGFNRDFDGDFDRGIDRGLDDRFSFRRGGVIRGMAGAQGGGLRLEQRRGGRPDGVRDRGRGTGRSEPRSGRPLGSMPHPAPVRGRP